MNKTFHMILVLTIVGFVSGTSLVFMYRYAHPLILDNQKNEVENALFRIFENAKEYEKTELGDTLVFEMKGLSGNFLGYAFLAEGNGYQGKIKMMAGIEKDLETLVGIEILESEETPGLGQEITKDDFKGQFLGLKSSPEIVYVKNEPPEETNEIQAITGATVSSAAVVAILNEKIRELKKHFGKL